jgi:hypothetical protein
MGNYAEFGVTAVQVPKPVFAQGISEVFEWLIASGFTESAQVNGDYVCFGENGGDHRYFARPGDYLVRHSDGEVEVIVAERFEARFARTAAPALTSVGAP